MKQLIHTLSLVCVVSACREPQLPDVSRSIPFVPRGFACTLLPSQAYSPGFIYRLDAEGVEWLTEDLSTQTIPRKYPAATGQFSASLQRGTDIQLSLTEAIGAVGSASASATSGAATTSTVSFEQAILLLLTDRQTTELLSFAASNIKPSPGSKYFVVRDTIQASSISIDISASDELKLGGEAKIANIVSAKPGFTATRQKSLVIKGVYPEPFNVCIRAVLLDSVGGFNPGTDVPVSGSGVPQWRISNEVASELEALRILKLGSN